jgi:hypothetical protein
LWTVPDIQPFPDGVANIDLEIAGYTVEVTDEDNPSLQDDTDDDKSLTAKQARK